MFPDRDLRRGILDTSETLPAVYKIPQIPANVQLSSLNNARLRIFSITLLHVQTKNAKINFQNAVFNKARVIG